MEQQPEVLTGTVERITFHNEESGFCVLRIKSAARRDLVTVVGQAAFVVPGEFVEAAGSWVVNREHGHQFQAAQIKTVPPDSPAGIVKFLGSGLIKGIGPVYAAKLVDAFGKEIFDVIENRSTLLEKVAGIGKVRRQRIKDSWNQTQAVRAIMAFLLSHGASTARAFRIYKTYGDEAISRVQADPYCLARDVRGIGFKTADQIATHFGITKDSDLRARAGVEYVLFELTQDGHCAYPRNELSKKAQEILDIPAAIVERAIDYDLLNGRFIEGNAAGNDTLVYLSSLFQAESDLVRALHRLASGPHPLPPVDIAKAIAWSEAKAGLVLEPSQREAVGQALQSKVMVITGGPGVGKTTIVQTILRIFLAKEKKVVLCAPTGRAAKRLTETTGQEAKTIHRLLAFSGKEGFFRHDENNPLPGDVFIVDEASMLDLPLASQLVRSLPPSAALLLVGDVDQLPSVGPGMVLRDIIESDVFTVCRLNQVFRQAATSQIITNAHAINDGVMPEGGNASARSDFYMIEEADPQKLADLVVRLIAEVVPSKFQFDPIEDIQVLTPMRNGVLGAHNLNRLLQQRLNTRQNRVQRFGYDYAVGDKVMQLENNYDKDVFNGDTGRIVRLDEEEQELVVCFDQRMVIYDFQELDELVPAYAITIHKSQGSEYPCVVIPVHTQHFIMLQRNLLYTAVTRARKLVVLVGTKKAIAIAVKRVSSHQRITTLRERLMAATKVGG